MSGTGASRTLDTGPMDQHYVSRYVSPPEYEDRAHRAMWEEQARYAMTKHCQKYEVILLDGAVGKWEPLRQNPDDPERVTMWHYRLVGWSQAATDTDAPLIHKIKRR